MASHRIVCREPTSDPEPYTLLDVGFQLLPEYCPKPVMHLNLQSAVLVLFYLHALLWAHQVGWCDLT